MNYTEDNTIKDEIVLAAASAARELCEIAKLSAGSVLVVGCSSSEITGGVIGHASSPETAEAVWEGIISVTSSLGIQIAAQCCEHLNRALVIERELYIQLRENNEVNAVPQPKAGGSFAACAYKRMREPVVIEEIHADAGLDIGSTLIGMHLKRVAVPVRLSVKNIGKASVTAARVRPKFIGGVRAVYDEEKM